MKLNKFSLFWFYLLRINFLCVVFITGFNITSFLDGINQILVGYNSNPLAVFVQVRGKLLVSVIANHF